MNQDFSIVHLLLNASWVVQLVVLLLLGVSVVSWAAIFRKVFALKKVRRLNEEFEREFIAHCLADADGCIGAMSHAAEAADWARLRDHAHAIKGVAANLGLARVAAQGSEMMRLADWQIRGEWRQRVAMLNAALTQGREALASRQQRLGSLRDGGGEPG